VWIQEFDDKLPVVQFLFAIPAAFGSIRIWQLFSILSVLAAAGSIAWGVRLLLIRDWKLEKNCRDLFLSGSGRYVFVFHRGTAGQSKPYKRDGGESGHHCDHGYPRSRKARGLFATGFRRPPDDRGLAGKCRGLHASVFFWPLCFYLLFGLQCPFFRRPPWLLAELIATKKQDVTYSRRRYSCSGLLHSEHSGC
jgi:hypothetical protein